MTSLNDLIMKHGFKKMHGVISSVIQETVEEEVVKRRKLISSLKESISLIESTGKVFDVDFYDPDEVGEDGIEILLDSQGKIKVPTKHVCCIDGCTRRGDVRKGFSYGVLCKRHKQRMFVTGRSISSIRSNNNVVEIMNCKTFKRHYALKIKDRAVFITRAEGEKMCILKSGYVTVN